MKREEVERLLGGYATGTLTPEEREELFNAALEDQPLFDQLMREEALREALSEPGAKQQLLDALDEASVPWWRRASRWLGQPVGLAAAACAAALLIAVPVWRSTRHADTPAPAIVADARAPRTEGAGEKAAPPMPGPAAAIKRPDAERPEQPTAAPAAKGRLPRAPQVSEQESRERAALTDTVNRPRSILSTPPVASPLEVQPRAKTGGALGGITIEPPPPAPVATEVPRVLKILPESAKDVAPPPPPAPAGRTLQEVDATTTVAAQAPPVPTATNITTARPLDARVLYEMASLAPSAPARTMFKASARAAIQGKVAPTAAPVPFLGVRYTVGTDALRPLKLEVNDAGHLYAWTRSSASGNWRLAAERQLARGETFTLETAGLFEVYVAFTRKPLTGAAGIDPRTLAQNALADMLVYQPGPGDTDTRRYVVNRSAKPDSQTVVFSPMMPPGVPPGR